MRLDRLPLAVERFVQCAGKGGKDMEQDRNYRERGLGFLLLCLALVLLFGYLVLRPFLNIFLMALVLATITYPIYRRLLGWTKERKSLSAFLSCLFVVFVIIVPCIVLVGMLARESVQIYGWVNDKAQSGALQEGVMQHLVDLQERFLPKLDLERIDMGENLTALAGTLSGLLVKWSTNGVKLVTSTVWQFVLMLFALFYFYKDGAAFLHRMMHLMPLPGSLEREIQDKFREVSESAFLGTFLTAAAQGFLGGLGFLIVGLQPLVWGVLMAVLSLIPLVGTFLVWGPAAILLMANGRMGAGIFLVIWGVVVVGLSDNVLRPMLMQGKSQLHPLLIFFSLIGGIMAFGPLGILLGPLAIVLVIAMLRAYEEAARPFLEYMDQR
jgi:predicted PurR-regulated permease PerM